MSLLWFWGFFGGMAAGYCLGRAHTIRLERK